MYDLLNRVVADRVVWLAAGNQAVPAGVGELIIRFNNATAPADIWATTFWDKRDLLIPHPVQAVIGTVPQTRVSYWTPTGARCERKFEEDYAKYDQSYPVEPVKPAHWAQLAAAMPVFPLSGIVTIAMLQTTQVRKMHVVGFDFYASLPISSFIRRSPQQIAPTLPYLGYHDYGLAIAFLKRLAVADERLTWASEISLIEVEDIWRRRLRTLKWYDKLRRTGKRLIDPRLLRLRK